VYLQCVLLSIYLNPSLTFAYVSASRLDMRKAFPTFSLLGQAQFCICSASHPTEPQCSYDPVEGLTLAPDADPAERIRQLEEQIGGVLCFAINSISQYSAAAALKGQLNDQSNSQNGDSPSQAESNALSPPSRPPSELKGIALPRASLVLDSQFRNDSSSPELRPVTSTKDPFMDLLFIGWNTDLPDPAIMNH